MKHENSSYFMANICFKICLEIMLRFMFHIIFQNMFHSVSDWYHNITFKIWNKVFEKKITVALGHAIALDDDSSSVYGCSLYGFMRARRSIKWSYNLPCFVSGCHSDNMSSFDRHRWQVCLPTYSISINMKTVLEF